MRFGRHKGLVPVAGREAESDEAGRMKPEDLVVPTPEKRDSGEAGRTEPESAEANNAAENTPESARPASGPAQQPDSPKNEGPAKVIAFANQKGGVA
jgi:hypothetical protein